ncbi:PREDICTED: sacsin isoform X2 [Tarenaya hassleriana]|uniref:sacsin isoform X1 n=1 Tax=Tarenaya hassleriana TaxID=28532 RepID=UPI00053C44B8|nr:PREDICTED: sacsin isoform X1 [Tarenaya hassleriana]XP_010547717.1 PREDICTED: sacsin isoform X2 [Tarenaya hassleriana]
MDSLLLEDFGQKVDLTRRIREVLLNYPEGTTVLKELIQNADDAGATRVCLCLDRRVHGSGSLLSDSLAQWQGPSLLAFNDAVFTEDDFVSISRIGGSGKHGQAWKTGRFGVGFNSVYHLTDLPSFVSGKYVVLFDPQGAYLPNISAANPGKRIDYVGSSALLQYKDQFSPYCVFGCDMKNPFRGTLFRFPLRSSEQAATSRLSRQAYFEADISLMFEQLFEEGIFSLLFLKCVLSIEIYTWDAGDPEPKRLYSCSVSSPNDDIIWHRQTVFRLSKTSISGDKEMDSFTLDFLNDHETGSQNSRRKDRFYIVQTMASSSSRIGLFAATASKEYDIHLLPWASVAACISDDSSDNNLLKLGQAFCFLPLPVRTGLSVQINGYFEVSSNRRGIWYGEDMDRSGKVRSAWNRLLLEDVVAPTFAQLLLCLRGVLDSKDSYYSIWPSGSFEEPWSILVEHIYKNISNSPVLFSDLQGGKWVSPSEAFLHDDDFSKSKELRDALLQLGMPLVHLPKPVFDMLLKHQSFFLQKVVTPDSVRNFLKECKNVSNLKKYCKVVLLEYCLEDLTDDCVCIQAGNLPLLPLANGDFGFFAENAEGGSYFICDELEHLLLQKVYDRVIDRNIPPSVYGRLSSIAETSKGNLANFSIHNLVQLFPRLVPADWKYKVKVSWYPDSDSDHPSSSWFVIFWQYLQKQCENLLLFCDWPIFPSTSGHLYRASAQSKLINVEKLPTAVKNVLEKIGCKILDNNFQVEHSDLPTFVSDASYEGVLDSIFDIASPDNGGVQTFLYNLTAEDKDELRRFLLDPKWHVGRQIGDSYLRNCRVLPIYRVYEGISAQEYNFSDLVNPPKYLPPLDVPGCLLGCQFVRGSSSSEDDVLLRFYGVERMGKASFYRLNVFDRVGILQPEIRDQVMISILQNLPQLSLEDRCFREDMRNLEFVPTVSGTLKHPAALHDPRNEELYALLEDSGSFPASGFQESAILDMLQGLGLRTAVSPETVLESARQVEQLVHTDLEKAHSRGKVLLSYLEVNAMKWLPDQSTEDDGAINRIFSRAATAFRPRNLKCNLVKFWNDLRMICWCPVLVSAPFQALPWPAVTSTVAPPKLVRPKTDMWLVSASMRILDGECSSTALAYNLGWLSPPGGSAIAAQLLELGKNNEVLNDQVLRQELALAMPQIYSILASLVGSDEMDIVKAVLEGSRWIWVGDGFATSTEVVLDGPLHLVPYVRVIPTDLAVFRGLFLELGIREYLMPPDYTDILCRMAARKGSSPLGPEEIRAAVLISQQLAEAQFLDKVIIYLPDVSGRLFPSSDLVFNDAPWLAASDNGNSSFDAESTMLLNAKRTTQKFVHGNISNEVGEKLGVRSLRRVLLAESADSMNLSLSGAAEAFGQHEALTTRLKHILEMYADGPGILFELVQNAEDAGASEVIFLLDRTQYGTSSLLSPEMADWQGPALYCFNNSVFTPQDLYAISRIGQASKLEKPFAIGRFGLGFNCVYHFTDIPAFVSGENIVMFDPHANHLPGISPSHPGLRIKFVGRQILDQFPDQFTPFLHFGCDLKHTFPGTLFRFPLRNASVASRSHIKKEAYAPEDVLSLFSSFASVVSETLLFLHNVKTISIFVKEGTGHEMQLLHRVCKDYIVGQEIESRSADKVFSLLDENRSAGISKDQLLKKLTSTIDKDLPYKCQKIVVTEQDSSGCMSHGWITGECLGGGFSKKQSNFIEMSHKLIPWASVAVLINSVKTNNVKHDAAAGVSDVFELSTIPVQNKRNFDGRAFCFLPLPISTGLPAHINAYFELSSNRRDIWFGNDMAGGGKTRSDWNLYLIEEIVVPAYGHLLEKIASELGPCDLFFSVWPVTIGLEPWASLVRKLYSFVANCGLRVLYTKARGGQWISTKQAILPDFNFAKADELVEVLADAGLPLVTISKSLAERFKDACPSLHFLTPRLLRTLLSRRKREFRDRDGLTLTLEYCLLDLEVPFQADLLYGLPLLPLADGSFTSFNKNGVAERIFVAEGNGHELLKDSLPHRLVDSEVPEHVHRKLLAVAQSEESNICLLSCNILEKLFFKLLPADWHLSKKVLWTPGQQGHPTVEWIKVLWSYLKLCCDELSIFSKWPILPVGDCCLMQLIENSNVIQDDGWSENMSSLLAKTGCQFLNREVPIEHPLLEKYVQPSTAAGILNAFLAVSGEPESINKLFCNASEGELQELRSFILQSKWFSGGQMNEIHFETIKHLPVFESYRNRNLVSLNRPVKWLKPDGIRDDLLDDDFVRLDSEKERVIFKRYLNIVEPSRTEFYKACVLNRMSEFLSQPDALLTILHDLNDLVAEDVSIKLALSSTPFVLASNGLWQQPSRLYDPRIPGLQKLLHREVYFPSETFSEPGILDALVGLGLRTSLDSFGYLDAARTVSILHDSGDLEALNYGRRLVLHIESLSLKRALETCEENHDEPQNVMLCITDVDSGSSDRVNDSEYDMVSGCLGRILFTDQSEDDFWCQLRSIPWCPIRPDPPLQGIPWLKSTNLVASPDRVRPKSQMFMVSATMHVLDGECRSSYLHQKLGWTGCLNIDILCNQLVELSKSYKQQKSCSSVSPDFETMLQIQIPLLYTNLQERIRTNDFPALRSALNGIPWVWIGDDFVSSGVLAFDSPVKFTPYFYVVPSELSDFRELLLELGVRLSFDVADYLNTLQRLQNDFRGSPLMDEQIDFVHCVLEAIADCLSETSCDYGDNLLLVPDSDGFLVPFEDLVYNDAPWVENSSLPGKTFVHPSINNDLAYKLGIKSLRCISLVDNDITQDIPCMDFAKLKELLSLYGDKDLVLFDLLELADCCKVKKLHLIFDKREHARKSLLQHNFGEFQGPAMVAILEGANLNRDEVSGLQHLSPGRIRGETLNYGLGLLSCYFLCDLLSIVSGGYFYMFDPQGLALSASTTHSPAAKMFSLIGTNLVERFRDQFNPMMIDHGMVWSSADSTIIRMPLSSEWLKDGVEMGQQRVKQISDRFLEHASRMLIFLKSVSQVSFSTWEQGNTQPHQDYVLHIDSSLAMMRNPFSEKKWRKFQISRLFSSSSSASKSHIIDVNLHIGESKLLDRWLVVLNMGSGQTRNMALDRRYLAYNLTPVAGVAAHVSRNGRPVDVNPTSSIMSPLPLSGTVPLPVTILGCFLVRHNGGRFLFKYQNQRDNQVSQLDAGDKLVDAWNRELMTCVRDSYIEMAMEMEKIRREHSSSSVESNAARLLALSLKAYGNQLYSFWPRSSQHFLLSQPGDAITAEVLKAEWQCVVEQVVRPFYVRVADLPLWQLYSGNLVKAEEGMFLTQPGGEVAANLLPVTVCSFVKEHYQVFSVPWELLAEIQAVGIPVREVKPKMVRDLLRKSSASIDLRSVDTYIDVLEYCLSDIQFPGSLNYTEGTMVDEGHGNSASMSTSSQGHSGSSDAFEMMTSIGKALFDLGRVVVEDIGRSGGPISQRSISNNRYGNVDPRFLSIFNELKGLPCPTATNHLARLGISELWLGNKEQQMLMLPVAARFIHPKVFDRSSLADIFSKSEVQVFLKLKSWSLSLLASNMKSLFHDHWVNYVVESSMVPWFSWENTSSSSDDSGPSAEWIQLFWKNFNGSAEDLSLFSDWPLIPAFLGRPILCRVREKHLIFFPPPVFQPSSGSGVMDLNQSEVDLPTTSASSPSGSIQHYVSGFELARSKHPWLISFLNQCNIPVYDVAYTDCAQRCGCLPSPTVSLGQVIVSKLAAGKHAGYITEITSFPTASRDELFMLLANDLSSNGSNYRADELEVLRSLPIFRTIAGSYTHLLRQDLCIISGNSFLKPYDACCFSYFPNSVECRFLQALGISVLHDHQILVRFGLAEFESRSQSEQDDILVYLYGNWQDLQANSAVIEALREAKFVRTSDEFSSELCKPKELFDPSDALLMSVFFGERKRFPGERFTSEGWLRILRKAGLRTAAEADVILECAKRVEFLGTGCPKSSARDEFETDLTHSEKEVSVELFSLAGSVLETIFSNFAVLYSNSFCNTLGTIACVPAESGFPSLGGRRGGKKVLTTYSQAILSRDWPLAWRSAPILSSQNFIPPEYSWAAFHLKSPPAFSTVLKHLQVIGQNGGEDTLAHWPNNPSVMTIEAASCEVLKYLEKVWGSLSPSDISELQKVAFLPAANGTRLVGSSSLFVRLPINLSPFAFELPSLYLPFLKILKDLGLKDELSVGAAKEILSKLQKVCGYQRLNLNELRAVMEILHFLCDDRDKTKASDNSALKSDAIVPDDGCRLVHARSCVYVDSFGSRYVKYIDTSRLRFSHPNVPEKICLDLGVRKLSDVVIEELDYAEQIQNLDHIGPISLEVIRRKLQSESFQAALWHVSHEDTTTSGMPFEDVRNSLQSAAEKIQFVKSIYTRFLLLPSSVDVTLVSKESMIPEWENESRHRTMYFLNPSRTTILVSQLPGYVSFLDVIATVVSEVLGFPTPLPIGSLFSCPQGSETAIATRLRLCSDASNSSTSSADSSVGREILSQDALQVQLHPLRPFYKGEIVAWKIQQGDKLRYGRVPEDVRPSAGQALYRFKVEISPGVTELLLSSQVFSFRSTSIENEGPSALSLEVQPTMNVNKSRETAESSRTSRTSSDQNVNEVKYGRVSAEELVQAVQEMLSAAGINMELEKQSLLQRTITLQEQLKESQAALLLEQERAEVAGKEAETAKGQWVCRICLTNEVDMTLVPCGHVLCRRCASAVSRCPFCRLQVAKTIRIFRP